jgi:tetratricopeptide (TPR) repeat protein
MKPKLYLIFLIPLMVVMVSCKSAKKMYEKGNYDEAVELAAKKLQKEPDDPKLLSIIREAYRYAEEDHQSNIRNHGASNNELKWEWIYNDYASLQRMYDAIYRVPEVFRIIKPVDYSSFLITYGEKAGDVRFDRGIHFMEAGDKASFRQAYREFQAALRFKPDHRDIIQKRDEAYAYAVTNVVILPMNHFGGYLYSGYMPGAMNFDDQLIHSLKYNNNDEFTRFYSAWEARGQRIRPDMELELRLSRMNIGYPHEFRDQRRVTKKVVIRETVYRPDSIVKEYADVYADITTVRRTLHSDAVLDVVLRDSQGGWLWSDHFPSTHSWSTMSVNFTGDQRALSESDKELIGRSRGFPPHEQEISRFLLDQISHNAVQRIRTYFQRFN